MTKVKELDTRIQGQERPQGNRADCKVGKRSLGAQLVEWVDQIMPDRF